MIHRKGRNTVDCVFVFSMQWIHSFVFFYKARLRDAHLIRYEHWHVNYVNGKNIEFILLKKVLKQYLIKFDGCLFIYYRKS
jgi:hypothetical protein